MRGRKVSASPAGLLFLFERRTPPRQGQGAAHGLAKSALLVRSEVAGLLAAGEFHAQLGPVRFLVASAGMPFPTSLTVARTSAQPGGVGRE